PGGAEGLPEAPAERRQAGREGPGRVSETGAEVLAVHAQARHPELPRPAKLGERHRTHDRQRLEHRPQVTPVQGSPARVRVAASRTEDARRRPSDGDRKDAERRRPAQDIVSATPTSATGAADAAGISRWWRRLRLRRRVVVVTAVTLIGVGAVVAVTIGLSSGGQSGGTLDNGAATSLATVVRRSLSSQTQSDATLGYARSYNVVNQARGTVTSLPSAGRVIRQGQSLYEVDGRPIILLYGSTPAYRNLSAAINGHAARHLT